MSLMMVDDLYDMRTAVVLGNYHHAVAESTQARCSSKIPEEVAAFGSERDLLVALAQCGLSQHDLVVADNRNATAPLQKAARLWAIATKPTSPSSESSAAVKDLVELTGETPSIALSPVAALAAAALVRTHEVTAALKLAGTWAQTLEKKASSPTPPRFLLELRAVCVDCLLRMHRPDLAERELEAMRTIDDDAPVTLLSSTAVLTFLGAVQKDRFREAAAAARDLSGRGQSASLLSIQAVAQLHSEPSNAEVNLVQALEKRTGDADALANMAVCSAQLGKVSEAVDRLVVQARTGTGTWAAQFSSIESRFDDAVLQFTP